MNTPPRTLVTDRDPLARRLVRDTLRSAGISVVAEAGTRREAIELARHYRVDLVVIAHTPPELDAVETTRAIADDRLVVVLTPTRDDELGLEALRAGAAGCLSKDIDLESLPRTVRAVCKGEAAISRRLTMTLVERFRTMQTGGAGLRPVRCHLTDREWEVLDLLVAGTTPPQIADRLVLSLETVRSHLKNLYRKLEVNTRAEAVLAASRLRENAGMVVA